MSQKFLNIGDNRCQFLRTSKTAVSRCTIETEAKQCIQRRQWPLQAVQASIAQQIKQSVQIALLHFGQSKGGIIVFPPINLTMALPTFASPSSPNRISSQSSGTSPPSNT